MSQRCGAWKQRAEIRFPYDKFPDGRQVDLYVSDFDCHVYYPRELELLFRLTGFRVEAWFGDYAMRRLRTSSRQLIGVGVKTVDEDRSAGGEHAGTSITRS